ncbi:MAG: hypothetical protein ABR508_04660 [Candidatus Baltobacteraceae bacterium]
MSYDLIVRGFEKVPVGRLKDTFREQPWWEIEGDAGGVMLTDTNTGVYVTIASEDRKARGLCYAINYNRPRFFALEALLTLQMLVHRHGWIVSDPQRSCELTFTAQDNDAVLAAWQRKNDETVWPVNGRPCVAREEATRVWNWNYARPQIDAQCSALDRDLYIPRIFFTQQSGSSDARTMMLWPHGVHGAAMPPVDRIVYRDDPDEAGFVVDRDVLLEAAAYYAAPLEPPGVPAIEAPRFSLLLSALQKAKRGPFTGSIAACDQLIER